MLRSAASAGPASIASSEPLANRRLPMTPPKDFIYPRKIIAPRKRLACCRLDSAGEHLNLARHAIDICSARATPTHQCFCAVLLPFRRGPQSSTSLDDEGAVHRSEIFSLMSVV